MAVRVGASEADILSLLKQMATGFSGKLDDPKYVEYAKRMTASYDALVAANDKQEQAKANLNSETQEVNKVKKAAREELSKAISFIESELGKTNPELQRFGIPKRQTAGRKSAKKSPDKP